MENARPVKTGELKQTYCASSEDPLSRIARLVACVGTPKPVKTNLLRYLQRTGDKRTKKPAVKFHVEDELDVVVVNCLSVRCAFVLLTLSDGC